MQVTHTSDHATHAVIGGKQTIELGVSNSAEFTHILSSTLYTNQKLAVIREVMCNAWDAHIVSGITDKPISVTLKDDYLIIQDFGTGIEPDMIGPIYGVYGNSTKKADGKQTGGFGLGSKAPFAYVDHFEVTSCFAGTKTIYSMAKVAPGVEGKGGITPLVSIPTTESGLTVKIRLVNSYDSSTFSKLIREVAFRGEIFATLNGDVLPVLPISHTKDGWAVVEGMDGGSNIFVRYGNVIYPIPKHDEYATAYTTLVTRLSSLGSNSNMARSLIIVAPPHSISVTPSREALSLQPHTVQALKTLLNSMIEKTDNCVSQVLPEYVRLVTKSLLKNKTNTKLFYTSRHQRLETNTQDRFIDRPSLLKKNFSLANLRYISDIKTTIVVDELRKQGEIPHNFAKSLTKAIRLNGSDKKGGMALETWLSRDLLRSLSRGMEKVGLDPTSWRIHCAYVDMMKTPKQLFENYYNRANLCDFMHLATSRVVLSSTPRTSPLSHARRSAIIDDDETLDDRAAELFGTTTLVYVVKSRKDEDVKAAMDFFSTRAKEVINMVPKYKPIVRKIYAKGASPTKKKVGYIPLSYALRSTDDRILDFSAHRRDVAEDKRVTDPACWILGTDLPKGDNTQLHNYTYASSDVIRLFGDKCAVVTEPQSKKLIEKSIPTWDEYVEAAILKEIGTNPKYLQMYALDEVHYAIDAYDGRRTLCKQFREIPELCKMFKIPDVPVFTPEEATYWTIWDVQIDRPYVKAYQPLLATFKAVTAVPTIQMLFDTIIGVKALRALDSSYVIDVLKGEYDTGTKTPSKHLLKMIIDILKEA